MVRRRAGSPSRGDPSASRVVDMTERDLSNYHRRTRERGVNRPLYWLVRSVLQPFFHLYFRLRRVGHQHIPGGGVILASNHRSFLDPWVVGACAGRPIYFFAKRELFKRPLIGWFLNSLGAFPVRRGESDAEALETSRALLARSDALLIFPEGTRIRTGPLGVPRRGLARLALETHAPVVPVAVRGSERARRGWLILPCRVQVRCGRALTFPQVDDPSPRIAQAVTDRVWPCVELQWQWLGGEPSAQPGEAAPMRRAA